LGQQHPFVAIVESPPDGIARRRRVQRAEKAVPHDRLGEDALARTIGRDGAPG
jgi:hypothetical protein